MKSIDKCLIDLQNGNDSAMEKLYTLTKKGVFAFVYSYLKNYHDAEDAMQTVYVKIHQGVMSYKPGTNAKAWVLQIAKNHCLNVIKKGQREAPLELGVDLGYEQTPLEEHGVMQIMKRVLSEEEQQIVTLHVLWGYKHREIAKILESVTGTITSKYKRAVEKIRNALKEERE